MAFLSFFRMFSLFSLYLHFYYSFDFLSSFFSFFFIKKKKKFLPFRINFIKFPLILLPRRDVFLPLLLLLPISSLPLFFPSIHRILFFIFSIMSTSFFSVHHFTFDHSKKNSSHFFDYSKRY